MATALDVVGLMNDAFAIRVTQSMAGSDPRAFAHRTFRIQGDWRAVAKKRAPAWSGQSWRAGH